MSNVLFFSNYPDFILPHDNEIGLALLSIFDKENILKEIELNVVFLDDESLLQYNIDFLNHNYYTDIITFIIEDLDNSLEAELYISIDRVKDNAVLNEVSFFNELYRVLIHGVLHLCGFNDSSEQEKSLMRSKENEYLQFECFT